MGRVVAVGWRDGVPGDGGRAILASIVVRDGLVPAALPDDAARALALERDLGEDVRRGAGDGDVARGSRHERKHAHTGRIHACTGLLARGPRGGQQRSLFGGDWSGHLESSNAAARGGAGIRRWCRSGG